MSVSFARLGKFSTIISSNRFSVPFCLSSGMLVVQNASVLDVVLDRPLSYPHF